jgi:thiol:disulfide interchange protein
MLAHRLLNLTVFAGLTFTGLAGVPAQPSDRQAAPPASATTAAQPKVDRDANRPLAEKEVWGLDYAQARQRAKALNRPVLLHFHATWCGPCQQMEQTVLNTNDVLKEIHSRCVAIKVDSDRNPDLVRQFDVTALPCDVLVRTDGKFQKVNEGALSADQYKNLISNVVGTRGAAPAPPKVAGN